MVAAITELLDDRRALTAESSVRRRHFGVLASGAFILLVVLQVAAGISGGSFAVGVAFALVFAVGTVLASSIGRRVDLQWVCLMGTLHVAGAMLATF